MSLAPLTWFHFSAATFVPSALIAAEPERYFWPPYVGHRGWIGVHLNRGLDWNEIAGAIEATASCGGPLMPPIMGAGAFIMAELTGVPYYKIIVAAALLGRTQPPAVQAAAFGTGPGALPTDAAMIGLDQSETRLLLEQGTDIIMQLLRSDDPV